MQLKNRRSFDIRTSCNRAIKEYKYSLIGVIEISCITVKSRRSISYVHTEYGRNNTEQAYRHIIILFFNLKPRSGLLVTCVQQLHVTKYYIHVFGPYILVN